ncbi:uncharacterized protein BXZ73DRAFT_80179 [Epithele typhae]|uniref:uncharacterized protein n=1 Tax=Epithele typhae TaxID=378194 RepID=UPI002008CB66|nr:uncharacterized protein BXZ73DRAFT_80179 [Epithele typhae]KAH9920235.1 hypothetical protein BXZ73DRAFT_80179 [Epithele typhae]
MASGASPAQSPAESRSTDNNVGGNDSYPPQRHAGAVGLGPEYAKGASTGEKVDGWKEEMKGKILRKPEVVQHGHDLRTGAVKKQQMEDDSNPFQNADEERAATTAPEGTEKADRQQERRKSNLHVLGVRSATAVAG